MADVQIRSWFEGKDAKPIDVKPGETEPEGSHKRFELVLADQINGKDIEFRKQYDVEPTSEQRAAFEGEAQRHFERNAKREGVVVDDPGVTPAAQPQVSKETRPAQQMPKQHKGTTVKKK